VVVADHHGRADRGRDRSVIIHDWRWVLRRAWSIRWAIASIIFSGLETACSVVTAMYEKPPFGIHPGIFAAFAGLCAALAFGSRFIAQKRDDE
jgi:hypothetical protein